MYAEEWLSRQPFYFLINMNTNEIISSHYIDFIRVSFIFCFRAHIKDPDDCKATEVALCYVFAFVLNGINLMFSNRFASGWHRLQKQCDDTTPRPLLQVTSKFQSTT